MPSSRNWFDLARWQPRPAVTLAIFVVAVAAMAFLRLYLFADRYVTITYGLPLLACLWYPSVRLLWSMAGAFIAMAAYKAFVLLPQHQLIIQSNLAHWTMQLANIVCVAATVHITLAVIARLRVANSALEESNHELAVREDEIGHQNEELTRQNEEIQQQSEELQQQAEELQVQAGELQQANAEIGKRRELLEKLLLSLRDLAGADPSPAQLCESLLPLFRGDAVAVVVVQREGDDVVVRGQAGSTGLEATRWTFASSLAALVMGQDEVAGIADLALRPDFTVARPATGAFRSVLAAPLHLNGRPAGAIEVFADKPYGWTRDQFQIIEWAAAQASLTMETRRLQQQLILANATLDKLVQARTTELQELVNELEHFSYTITHDLRAPLRAMRGFAQLLEEESASALDENSRDYLRRISVAARRMDQLISDALSYSRAVRLDLAMAPTDPAALLRGMIESYPAFQAPKAQIELPEKLPLVLANEAALTQCFSNLLDNAVKFVPPGRTPRIRIHAEERDHMVRLWFEDNGIGIPHEMQQRVFMMFQRLSKEYEGTGIGLALVRKVAERMGGRVGVESEHGHGSRFWLELKRVD